MSRKIGEARDFHAVRIHDLIGLRQWAIAADASALYAKNLIAFLPLITAEDGALNLETDDEIVTAMLLTRGGDTVNERISS